MWVALTRNLKECGAQRRNLPQKKSIEIKIPVNFCPSTYSFAASRFREVKLLDSSSNERYLSLYVLCLLIPILYYSTVISFRKLLKSLPLKL